MNICVYGLWHLGCVTAACMAKLGASVIGVTEDQDEAEKLNSGTAPISEPELNHMITDGIGNGKLQFTSDLRMGIEKADYVWVCFDTPIDENDVADEAFVFSKMKMAVDMMQNHQSLIISSQLSVGATRRIEKYIEEKQKRIPVAYSPENLRLGKAIQVFLYPDRIIIGVRNEEVQHRVAPLFSMITDKLLWMRPESAEMAKHAINGFLATSVVFINEISTICEAVGADATEVSEALKSEERIGPKAYLKPGSAFAGGTLGRDIQYLVSLSNREGIHHYQLDGTHLSNDDHRNWTYYKIIEALGSVAGKRVFVCGLTYKEGTDTLRRSLALELIRKLARDGAEVTAYDPNISSLPDEYHFIHYVTNYEESLKESDCVVISSSQSVFKEKKYIDSIMQMRKPVCIDENGLLFDSLHEFMISQKIDYYTIGKGKLI